MIAAIDHLGLLDDEEIPLDIAALELSALDHGGVDLDPYVEMLAAVENDLRALAGEADSALDQAEALALIIAGRWGFAGDNDSYDAPLNTDMIRVIDRRKGLPISLSILYASQARRLGWSADVLNVPGHVLVRLGPIDHAVLIDPFHGGVLVTQTGLLALLRRMLGPEARIEPQYIAPMTNRLVLVRLLVNQATRAERDGDFDRARTVYERIVTVAPSNAPGWWELARLQRAAGLIDEARVSLSAMLEITRDGESRAHIAAALGALGTR